MGVQRKTGRRKQYTAEFKREAVRLMTEGGLNMAQVARDLGLDDNLASRWKKEAQENGQRAFPGQGHSQDEELTRLRRENDVLRQERDILKKVISSFSDLHPKLIPLEVRGFLFGLVPISPAASCSGWSAA